MASNDGGSHRIDSTTNDDQPTRTPRPDRADHPGRAQQHSPERVDPPVAEQRVLPAKTSAAAVFALVFGLSALLAVLTIILSPLALILSIIGIILGIVGIRMARRVGVTGRTVAIAGLILSVLALILSITIAAGITTVLNNKSAVDRINKQVTKLENKLPDKATVPTP